MHFSALFIFPALRLSGHAQVKKIHWDACPEWRLLIVLSVTQFSILVSHGYDLGTCMNGVDSDYNTIQISF